MDAWHRVDVNVVCSNGYGCHNDVTLLCACKGYAFTIFILIYCGWVLLPLTIVQDLRKKRLSN